LLLLERNQLVRLNKDGLGEFGRCVCRLNVDFQRLVLFHQILAVHTTRKNARKENSMIGNGMNKANRNINTYKHFAEQTWPFEMRGNPHP
jgi:hypothetical protein